MSKEAVRAALSKRLDAGGVGTMLYDGRYFNTDFLAFERLVRDHWMPQRRYVADEYDCDDFALWFKAWASWLGVTAVGIVLDWSSDHAYNVIVFPLAGYRTELSVLFLEPQTGKFIKPGEGLYRLATATVMM